MLHRIYSKNKDDKRLIIPDLKEFKDYLNCIIPGSKVKWRNEKRRYTCIDRSDNFIIVAKPFNLIPKFKNADKILEISQRGWCNIEDVIDEIWVEATYVG